MNASDADLLRPIAKNGRAYRNDPAREQRVTGSVVYDQKRASSFWCNESCIRSGWLSGFMPTTIARPDSSRWGLVLVHG
jgi:hypothetical protein